MEGEVFHFPGRAVALPGDVFARKWMDSVGNHRGIRLRGHHRGWPLCQCSDYMLLVLATSFLYCQNHIMGNYQLTFLLFREHFHHTLIITLRIPDF